MTGSPIWTLGGTWHRPGGYTLPGPDTPRWASQMVDSVAVCAHINRTNNYGTGWTQGKVQAAFSSLGVKRYRVLGENSTTLSSRINTLYSSYGAKAGVIWSKPNVATTPTVLHTWAVNNVTPGAIVWAEGANEWNIGVSGGGYAGWQTDARAHQLDIWNTITGSAQSWIRDITVLGPSIGNAESNTGAFALLGDLTDRCHSLALHLYWARGDVGPSGLIDSHLGYARVSNPNHPYAMTEMGLHNDLGGPSTHNPADETTGGIYTPVGYAEHFLRGAKYAAIYELVDENDKADHEGNFGLYRADWTPKPAATALSRLMSIISDTGPGAALNPIPGTLAGPADLKYFWLQKANGKRLAVVWRDVKAWDWTNEVPIAVTAQPVTLNLVGPFPVKVWRPHTSSLPIATYTSTQSVTAQLAAGVTIMEVG